MANQHSTLASLFSDIASAIRQKSGKTDTIIADNFPGEIAALAGKTDIGNYWVYSGEGYIASKGTLDISLPSGRTVGEIRCGYAHSASSKIFHLMRNALPSEGHSDDAVANLAGEYLAGETVAPGAKLTSQAQGAFAWVIDPSEQYLSDEPFQYYIIGEST